MKIWKDFESPIKSDERVFVADAGEPTLPASSSSSSLEDLKLKAEEAYEAGTEYVLFSKGSLRHLTA